MYKHSTFNDDSFKLNQVDSSPHEWHDSVNIKIVYLTSSFKATRRPLGSLLESARRFYSLEVDGMGIFKLKIVIACNIFRRSDVPSQYSSKYYIEVSGQRLTVTYCQLSER
jgi:hypothetical protein